MTDPAALVADLREWMEIDARDEWDAGGIDPSYIKRAADTIESQAQTIAHMAEVIRANQIALVAQWGADTAELRQTIAHLRSALTGIHMAVSDHVRAALAGEDRP